jgi:hypothetical protein
MKYRKKPVVIEALQWTGQNHRDMFNFLESVEDSHPMTTEGHNFYTDRGKVAGGLIIKTLEGEHLANCYDVIIKGVRGEFYPCKPDIFQETYEAVEQ